MKYRGNLQETMASVLKRHRLTFKYETDKLSYVVPAVTVELGVEFSVELKRGQTVGVFIVEHFTHNRMTALAAVKEQQPDLDIRIIFSNPEATLINSHTTYGEWCDERGIQWAQARYRAEIKSVIERWIRE